MTLQENPFIDDSFARHVGIELTEAGDGSACAQLQVGPQHVNGAGVVHGGAIFTLAAWTMAVAANTKYPVSLGLNASITWLRPATAGTLTARAAELSAAGRISVWNVSVTDEESRIIATLQGTACRRSD